MSQMCGWAGPEEIYIKYHDCEWGVPVYDGRLLWQMPVSYTHLTLPSKRIV